MYQWRGDMSIASKQNILSKSEQDETSNLHWLSALQLATINIEDFLTFIF